MIVECPECKTKFNVKAHLLGLDGRAVRCGLCHYQWETKATEADIAKDSADTETIEVEVEIEEIEEGVETNDEVEEESPVFVEPSFPEEKNVADVADRLIDKKFIAVSFTVFLLLTVMFALLSSARVIRAFPNTYPIYKMLGLVHSDIAFYPVDAMYREDHFGESVLYIELELENLTQEPQEIFPLKVDLYDDNNVSLKYWLLPASKSKLPPHETKTFKFGLKSAPEGGKRVVIRKNLEQFYGVNTKDSSHEDKKEDKTVNKKENDKTHQGGGHH